jgi:uncharacterized protein (TIGR03437 family)
MENNWADGYTEDEYEAERDEIRALGEYLLGNPAFANKKFIILNWEGDNAMYYSSNKRKVWDYFTAWIKSRAEGVKLARQSFPSSKAHLFSGLEFNTVKGIRTGQACGTPVADPIHNDTLKNRCVIDFVAPYVEVDYYSYSAWSTVAIKANEPNADLKKAMKDDLEFALAKVRARRPEVTAHNFILGEFGFDRTQHGECYVANFVNEVFDAFEGSDSFPVSYIIFWQIVDNARSYGSQGGHFGLFRVRDNALNLTLPGETFKKRLAGQQVPIYNGCPRIRQYPPVWGVLNQQGTTDFYLNPDPLVSIYTPNCCQSTDSPFSRTGNTVHFAQNVGELQLPRENETGWQESETQINFSFPPARRPGYAHIYVTDARGIDSNAQGIILTCPNCPQINAPCGIQEVQYLTSRIESSQVISIPGSSFSPSGNTVIIEQRETSVKSRRWLLSREQLMFESHLQIDVRLPNDLATDRETIIYVADAKGHESSEIPIYISGPCQECRPQFRTCQPIVDENGGNFAAGTLASIMGRFPLSGNKVILEQVDQQYRVYQYTISQGSPEWIETDSRIRFKLPSSLFAGRALFYIVDSKGRETSAKELTISPSGVINVSAANYRGPMLAAESIAAAFGTAMATTTQSAVSSPLPTELDGTRIIIKDSVGVERAAPLFFVSPAQINFQLPAGLATGTATATVMSGFGSSSVGSIQIVDIAPGLFSAESTGKGFAAAVVLRVSADGTLIYEPAVVFDQTQNKFLGVPIDLSNPREQVFLILFGTGLRARSSLAAVTASVGGVNCEVIYAGPQNDFVGLDQINVRLLPSLIGRGEVGVLVTVDGQQTNILRIKTK